VTREHLISRLRGADDVGDTKRLGGYGPLN
jgi:hypothetical protein